MEKRYIAFLNGSSSSGIQTRDNAIKWAAEQMGNKSVTAYLAEVTEVIERKTPPIEIRAYILPTQETAKAA